MERQPKSVSGRALAPWSIDLKVSAAYIEEASLDLQSTIMMPASSSTSASERLLGDSGIEPDLKRRRLLDAGGPIEDEETARQKMRDAEVYTHEGHELVGFDPDNVSDRKEKYSWTSFADNSISPMGYFAGEGELKMMRWLYVNGADTRDEDVDFWFPMYRAAQGGKIDACRWLAEHGAAGDVKRRCKWGNSSSNGSSPLQRNFEFNRAMSRWLILNGALCQNDDTGALSGELLRQDLRESYSERKNLLDWAIEQHQCRKAFIMFLQGTLGIPDYSPQKLLAELTKRNRSERAANMILKNTPTGQYKLLWEALHDNPVKLLREKRGILELISEFAGVMHGRGALIIRQLTETLPKFISEEHALYTSDSDEFSDY